MFAPVNRINRPVLRNVEMKIATKIAEVCSDSVCSPIFLMRKIFANLIMMLNMTIPYATTFVRTKPY